MESRLLMTRVLSEREGYERENALYITTKTSRPHIIECQCQ